MEVIHFMYIQSVHSKKSSLSTGFHWRASFFLEWTDYSTMWNFSILLTCQAHLLSRVYQEHCKAGHICPLPQRRTAKSLQGIPYALWIFQNHLAGLQVSVCTMFQVSNSYGSGVMVPKVIFDFFSLSDPRMQDGHPKINRHLAWPYTRVFCTK